MALKDREKSILDYLKQTREASVGELCSTLFVSEPTMRRDLSALARSGKIIRTHGGAMYRGEQGANLPPAFREKEHSDAKAVIARKCLPLIREGSVIMADGSSTASALLRILPTNFNLAVVTNGAKAPLSLAESGIKTFVTGGELATDSYAYTGGRALEFLRSFNADICFFSVRTLTRDGLLTDNAIAENEIRKVMLSRSKIKVLLLDAYKVGEPCLNTLCSLDDIDFVVSERDISTLFANFNAKFL